MDFSEWPAGYYLGMPIKLYGVAFPIFNETGGFNEFRTLDMLELDKLEKPAQADVKVSYYSVLRSPL